MLFGGRSTVAESSCSDVRLVYLRGSGQPRSGEEINEESGNPEFQEFHSEQKEGAKFNEELIVLLKNGPSYTSISIDYPADDAHVGNASRADVNWWGNYNDPYHISQAKGVEMLLAEVRESIASCSDQQLILGGYSQGAHVIGDSLHLLTQSERNHIAYVALFGDPRFNVNSFAARGTFTVKRVGRSGGVLESREEFPADMQSRITSWCLHNDGICENRATKLKFGSTHGNYPLEYVPIAARLAANSVISRLNEGGENYEYSQEGTEDLLGAKDVIFIAASNGDNETGALKQLRLSSEGYAGNPVFKSSNINFAYGRYGGRYDRHAGEYIKHLQNFGPWSPGFQYFFHEIKLHRGAYAASTGSYPLMYGVENALQLPQLRGVETHLIILSNGGFAAVDPATAEKITRIINLQESLNARVHVMLTPWPGSFTLSETFPELQELDLYFEADIQEAKNINEIPAIFNQVLNSIVITPPGPAKTSYTVSLGEPVRFTVASSFSPAGQNIKKYSWDFNNDGVIDRVTSGPTTNYTYPAEYIGQVKVYLELESGQTDKYTLVVNHSAGNSEPLKLRPVVDLRFEDNRLLWLVEGRGGEDVSVQQSGEMAFSIHGEDGRVLGVSGNEFYWVDIPQSTLDEHSRIGVAVHSNESESEIVYTDTPQSDQPAVPEESTTISVDESTESTSFRAPNQLSRVEEPTTLTGEEYPRDLVTNNAKEPAEDQHSDSSEVQAAKIETGGEMWLLVLAAITVFGAGIVLFVANKSQQ